eukprot:10536749-Prorocentrum_lima.AAC.1
MSTYELLDYDDPRRSNRAELENSVRQGSSGYSQRAAAPAPKKNTQKPDEIPAAPAPKKSRRPRSTKPPQHENDRVYAAPGSDKGGKGGKGKWDRTRTPPRSDKG